MTADGQKADDLISSIEKKLSRFEGFTVWHEDGTLKSTYEILESLVPIYEKATSAQKAYITEAVAGKIMFC